MNRQIEKDKGGAGKEDRMDKYILIRAILKYLPYPVGSALFRALLSNPVSHKVLRKHVRALESLNTEITNQTLSREAVTKYLLVNFTGYWRLHALINASTEVFNKYVQVRGQEYLTKYVGHRGVVLCNSHYGAGKIAPVAIARMGYDLASVERTDVLGIKRPTAGEGEIDSIVLGKKSDGANFHLKQIFKMKKTLKNKGILHIAADGYRGGSGREYPFLGKRRSFPQSFAQLAVATDAVVLPVFSCLRPDGRVQIELLEPFDPQKIEGSSEDKIKGLCEQYISLLEARWKQKPENLFNNDIHIFSSLKPAQSPVLV